MNSMLQQRIQLLMDDLVASGDEVGLQVTAYVNGELVVDAWAGVADEATGRMVNGDTLFTSWSTTKGRFGPRATIWVSRITTVRVGTWRIARVDCRPSMFGALPRPAMPVAISTCGR